MRINRRGALGALGLGVAGATGGLVSGELVASRRSPAAAPESGVTVARWAATRGPHWYIGHRGSGDVFPEHTLPAYLGALAAGAACLEVSVGRTGDGVLVCMHDATYDRTTTATGRLSAAPASILQGVSAKAPQLGPAWERRPATVPLLAEVLAAVGGRAILAIEAKDDAAYPAMVAMIERNGLRDSVIIKADHLSKRIDEAKAAGYPVFGYIGAGSEVSADAIAGLGRRLGRGDHLVLPTTGADGRYLSDDFIRSAVATGVPVGVFPVHRRSEADHFLALGCTGVITSGYGYVTGTQASTTADTWTYGAIAPGELTRDPSGPAYAPTWVADELHLTAQGNQHFLTLGQLAPLAAAARSYTVAFSAMWTSLPANSADHLTLAFARADDSYYQSRLGQGSGYHALLRGDGRLELFRHADGQVDGVRLAGTTTPPPIAGQWMDFQVQVTPGTLSWARTDLSAARVGAADAAVRGGYLHIGRSSTDGVLAFRRLTVN